MKLGLGLYSHQLNEESFSFAEQAGCTHLIIHLASYYKDEIVTSSDSIKNYGISLSEPEAWSYENMKSLQEMAERHNLTIYGIENFNPIDWHDVLLDGPNKLKQLENLKKIIKSTGKAGIKSIGYNFSLAGVWGHQRLNVARGGAESACFDASMLDMDANIPNGEVWNMTYDPNRKGFINEITHDEFWDRLKYFLDAILPVAEENGVEMALHPDDPPMPILRGTPRLVYQPHMYQRLIDLNPSTSNKIEFCMGSIQEMTEGDLYEAIENYAGQNKISYVHFRNVKGKVPAYQEVFIDEGDIDILKALKTFKKAGFDGVFIPDHTPLMGPLEDWYTGMAYALGYMKAAFSFIGDQT